MPDIHLIYPENRWVSEVWITRQYVDCVANCICHPGARTTPEQIAELESAGVITVSYGPKDPDTDAEVYRYWGNILERAFGDGNDVGG